MRDLTSAINAWLSTLPQPANPPPEFASKSISASVSASPTGASRGARLLSSSRKRKLELNTEVDHRIPSPPRSGSPPLAANTSPSHPSQPLERAMSEASHLSTPPPQKKQKRSRSVHNDNDDADDDASSANTEDDPDATPTQNRRSQQSRSNSQRSVPGSGASSPRKKLVRLALRSDGIEPRVLNRGAHDLPLPLRELLDDLLLLRYGSGIVSSLLKDSLEIESKRNPDIPPLPSSIYAAPEVRDVLGPTPGIHEVLGIVKWANRMQARGADEAAWNSAVHHPLLRLALHGDSHPDAGNLVDFTQCTTANIIKEYLPTQSSGKKVDFVLHLDPAEHASASRSPAQQKQQVASSSLTAAQRIDALRASLPLSSINHTDYEALANRPVSVSIETKRVGGNTAEAELQMGVWQAAQWNMLAQRLGGGDGDGGRGDSEQNKKQQREERVAFLGFLPGIIIRGHDWMFAATSRSGDKTILWTEYPFGSTRDVIDVYKIIYVLQLLARWSRQKYWPWFQEFILGLSVEKGDEEAMSCDEGGAMNER